MQIEYGGQVTCRAVRAGVMDSPRLALFGGSFDPPHRAHFAIAAAAVEQCALNRVIFIPCQVSPLKGRQPAAPGEHRLAMLRLAIAGCPWAEVSDWELERPGLSYSWQSVEHFAVLHPRAALHWLMGVDQWASLERWARPDFLREHLTFIVFGRNGLQPQPRPGWRAHFLQGEWSASSTEARTLLAAGRSAEALLVPAVEEYALTRRLYRTEGL